MGEKIAGKEAKLIVIADNEQVGTAKIGGTEAGAIFNAQKEAILSCKAPSVECTSKTKEKTHYMFV